jgi:CARDB
MRRTAAPAALLLALAPGVTAASASPPSGSARALPAAAVRVVECLRPERTAAFHARVRAIRGSQRMSLRFTLQERNEPGPWQPLQVPALDRWRQASPGRAAFGVRQRVRNLAEGRSYRMRVDFRWFGSDGKLLRGTLRRSAACNQFGPRPNLRARVVDSRALDAAGLRSYTVRVVNAGRGPAAEAAVRLSVDGAEVNTRGAGALEPGQATKVTFRGPACESTVYVLADPLNALRESSETDNGSSRPCAELS